MKSAPNNQKLDSTPIAEMNNGIILAKFEKSNMPELHDYQSEAQLEASFIDDLVSQGYERVNFHSSDALYLNLRQQIQRLNSVEFSDSEWKRFLSEYLNNPNDGFSEKTEKIQQNSVYDFTFDNGEIKNIKILDKKNIHNNHLQVTNQIKQTGSHSNRYDVTILINGLPLVHIELKKRGANIREAFNQIQRYVKESFDTEDSLFKFVQIFVVSNGTKTKYFSNTVARGGSYDFASEWADARNNNIHDLRYFTKTFFEKRVILEVLIKYCIFNVNKDLMILRPYQIAATERILQKIKSGYQNNLYGSTDAGGFVWHTTGSGKTMTSFKAARLAMDIDFIDKVFFVVDRKDLDYQTMREYDKFQKGSVSGTVNTRELLKNIEKRDGKIIVTTIQKLNEFVKNNKGHEIQDKHCVFIFDECHRSQFGEAQKNIKKFFKKYYQFGFTGTPIFPENAIGVQTTADVFGAQLHSYVITDAIRDEKVLKFKVDYVGTTPKFKQAEQTDEDKVSEKELVKLEKTLLLHPERISEVVKYIIEKFDQKTHRNIHFTMQKKREEGFNAMLAVQSVQAAKIYYEEFNRQQSEISPEKRLRVGTIFSFAANEDQKIKGEIADENFNPSAMDLTSKEFLDSIISNYNTTFKTNFSTEGGSFQDYYKDLAKRTRDQEIDILIVVGMFLTGFDAPRMNTIFVDKNLRYHGLIQAFSRTNRIYNSVKTFGNIVCFRDLEEATNSALRLFGNENSLNVVLEKSYREYMEGTQNPTDNPEVQRGFEAVCNELLEKFPDPAELTLESDKKDFISTFNEYLKLENILKNFDEFSEGENPIPEAKIQDFKSMYIEISDEFNKIKESEESSSSPIDISDLVFETELLKTDEVNLDYILTLIADDIKDIEDTELVKEKIRKMITSSVNMKPKEDLIMEFIDLLDIKEAQGKDRNDIISDFYVFAKDRRTKEVENLISSENLKPGAKNLIEESINRGQIDGNGMKLDSVLGPVSIMGGGREIKKKNVLTKIRRLIDIFIET